MLLAIHMSSIAFGSSSHTRSQQLRSPVRILYRLSLSGVSLSALWHLRCLLLQTSTANSRVCFEEPQHPSSALVLLFGPWSGRLKLLSAEMLKAIEVEWFTVLAEIDRPLSDSLHSLHTVCIAHIPSKARCREEGEVSVDR